MSLYGGIELVGRPDLENIRRLDLLCVPMINRMQRVGVAIDLDYLAALGSEIAAEMVSLQQDIANYIPPESLDQFVSADTDEDGNSQIDINANSAVQIRELLFNLLSVGRGRDLKQTAAGLVSTGKKTLELCREDHPVVPLVLKYRERSKLKSAFCDSLPKFTRLHPRGACCPVCELPHTTTHRRVHGQILTTRAETGRLAMKRPNCFDGSTEVLTRLFGWVPLRDFNEADHGEVAQWRDGQIEFVSPIGSTQQVGDLIRYTSQHIDLCVTEDHRCLLQHRKTSRYRVFKASEYPSDWKQLSAGIWNGGSGINLTDAEIRLLIAIQADGSVSRKNGRTIDISFSKRRKVERLKEILAECGVVGYYCRTDERRTRFRFEHSRCTNLLLDTRKLFGPFLLKMNRQQTDVFLSEIMFWDGCWTTRNQYKSKHKINADWVQTMFSLSGIRANVNEQVVDGKSYWNTTVSRNDYTLTTNVLRESYGTEFTYCLSVPSSFLVVRRNNKVMITGNCMQIPTRSELGGKVRKAFIAPPGRRLISVDFSQCELRDLAHMANAKSMIDVYHQDRDIHIYTACRAFGRDYDHYADLSVKKDLGTLTADEKADWKHFALYERLPSKNLNFMIVYGASWKGLQAQLALSGIYWDEAQCKDFIARWFGLYAEVEDYLALQEYRARRYGVVWTPCGRIRRVPEMKSCHPYKRSEGIRQAGNMPIQGCNAEQTKLVMGELQDVYDGMRAGGTDVEALLPIHDEIISESDEESAELIGEIKADVFQHVMYDKQTGANMWRVPIGADYTVMSEWVKG